MLLTGNSVILVIKMPEEDDTVSDVMGPKGTPRLDNARAVMDPLNERRRETHMLHHDHKLHQDPWDGHEAVKTPRKFEE